MKKVLSIIILMISLCFNYVHAYTAAVSLSFGSPTTITAPINISGNSDVYGIYVNSSIVNIDNSGGYTINVTPTSVLSTLIVGIYTSQFTYAGTLINAGDINIIQSYSTPSTTHFYSSNHDGFIIEGNNSGSFMNSGDINISVDLSNISTTNYIAYEYNKGINASTYTTFQNTGDINMWFTFSDIGSLPSHVYSNYNRGIYYAGQLPLSTSFNNSGDITINQTFSNFHSDLGSYITDTRALDIYNINNNFSNFGNISLTNSFNNIEDNTYLKMNTIYGAWLNSINSIVNNTGNITIANSITNSTSPSVLITDVTGLYMYGTSPMALISAGDISLSSTISGGNFTTAELSSHNVMKLYNGGLLAPLGNSGNFTLNLSSDTATAFNSNYIFNIDTFTTTLNNTGNLSYVMNGATGSTFGINSIFYINNSTVTLSNTGAVNLLSNMSNTGLKTLYIKSNSNVTLGSQFNVGIGAYSGSESEGTIYVDGTSELNLNNAILGVYTGSHFQFDTAYPIIKNDGTVTALSVFSDLTYLGSNPDINLEWYDSERGENAKVIARYVPDYSQAVATLLGTISGGRMVMKNTGSMFTGGGGIDLTYNAENMLASEEMMTDANYIKYPDPKGTRLFIVPVYSTTDSDNFGFDSESRGYTLGYRYEYMPYHTATIYGGALHTTVHYDEKSYGDDSIQNGTFVGFSTDYDKEWYANVNAVYLANKNNNNSFTGNNLTVRESSDVRSETFNFEALGGYNFNVSEIKVRPIGGLGATYAYIPSYKTEIGDAASQSWEKYYKSSSNWDYRAIAGLTAEADYILSSTYKLNFSAGAKYEYALDDNDVSVEQAIPGMGTGYSEIEQEVANFNQVYSFGVALETKSWKLGLATQADYTSDQTSYTYKASASWKF